jgi:glucose/arabinose dehydrogenase
LRLVKGGRLVAAPVDGVPEVFAAGQGGLLDVSLHPRFSENRLIYFSYAYGSAKTNHTRVAVAEFDGDRLDNWRVIFQVGVQKSGTQHFGSRLLWLPDESLLVSIGDGGNPPVRLAGDWIRKQAQNKQNHLGKILRLDGTGDAPQGNPFADRVDAVKTIWSYGHRNIQGLAYDSLRKVVWASEHGALGGDELNRIQKGGQLWMAGGYLQPRVRRWFQDLGPRLETWHGGSAGGLDDGYCTLWADGLHRRPISPVAW